MFYNNTWRLYSNLDSLKNGQRELQPHWNFQLKNRFDRWCIFSVLDRSKGLLAFHLLNWNYDRINRHYQLKWIGNLFHFQLLFWQHMCESLKMFFYEWPTRDVNGLPRWLWYCLMQQYLLMFFYLTIWHQSCCMIMENGLIKDELLRLKETLKLFLFCPSYLLLDSCNSLDQR